MSEVTIHKVAAMPESDDFEVGYGLEELLGIWNKPYTSNQVAKSHKIECKLNSEFNKLIYEM